MKVLGIIVGLFLAMVACGAIVGSGNTPTTSKPAQLAQVQPAANTVATPATPPIPLNLVDMGKDYHNNKVSAESKWGGQYVQFTAPILNISDGWSPGVSFNLPPDMFSQIVCRVGDESKLNRPDLTTGHRISVRGVVDGDQTMGVVSLNNCEIVG